MNYLTMRRTFVSFSSLALLLSLVFLAGCQQKSDQDENSLSSAQKLKAKQAEKEAIESVDTATLVSQANAELDEAEESIRKDFLQNQEFKAVLERRTEIQFGMDSDLEEEIRIFNRGKEWLKSHSKKDKYLGESGEVCSYDEIIRATTFMIKKVQGLERSLQVVKEGNCKIRDAIAKADDTIDKRLSAIEDCRMNLQTTEVELETIKIVNRITSQSMESVFSSDNNPILAELQNRLAQANAEQAWREKLEAIKNGKNFLEEDGEKTDLERISEFSPQLSKVD